MRVLNRFLVLRLIVLIEWLDNRLCTLVSGKNISYKYSLALLFRPKRDF